MVHTVATVKSTSFYFVLQNLHTTLLSLFLHFHSPMASLATNHTDRENKYIKDAKKHQKEAKKRLTTSFTKWKADYLMAGPEFAKAGNAYRLGKEPKLAVECYMNAAQCGEKCGQEYETGKYRDLAAQILSKSSDKADRIQAAELYEATMNIFLGMEDFMGGATACKKAVSIWSKIDVERALTLNRQVIDQLEAVGRGTYALEMYRETISLAIKADKWTMAHEMIKKAVIGFVEAGRPPAAIYSWHLSEMIVLAKIGDNVALDEAFLESLSTSGYGTSDEAEAAEEINRGCKDRDVERLSAVTSLRGMKQGLLPVILNLAKKMWETETSAAKGPSDAQKQRYKAASSMATRTTAGGRSELFGNGSASQSKKTPATKAAAAPAAATAPAAPAAAAAPEVKVSDDDDDTDDLLDGLDDLLVGLPEANDDDDDLL